MPLQIHETLVELSPQVVWTAVIGLAGLFLFYQRVAPKASIRQLPGPPRAHWLFGHEWDVYRRPAGQLWNEWIETYGSVVRYRNAFFDGLTFHKPPFNRQTNQRLLGKGVIWAEGQDHRSQRRLLSPAFSNSSVVAVSGAFYRTADDLKEAWNGLLDRSSAKSVVLNVAAFMSSAALDVIGMAGFEHDFKAVRNASREAAAITDGLTAALGAPPSFEMFTVSGQSRAAVNNLDQQSLTLAKAFPFFFNHAPLKAIRNQRASKASIDKVAYKVLERADASATTGKSILSILLKERQKGNGLSDREIVDNVSTMITAGHETTGITLSLILYELAKNTAYQNAVRKELIGDRSLPSFEELQDGQASMLDAMIKEVLRFYPANIRIIRRTDKDQVIPLTQPIKTATGTIDSVFIPTNTDIVFPLTSINRMKSIWGPDGDVFRPERWLEKGGIPDTVKALPSGYDHIFTFISGPRACLGMRFAIAEMRVILSAIIASFKYELDNEKPLDIVSPAQIMIRAQDQERKVYGVPLRITRVEE
ncbi:hypothetical protein Q5752_004555 [Cryptotrichosporon argae]